MADGEFLSARGKISGVEVRSYAREPSAYIEPKRQHPKYGHQDSNTSRVRVPEYEGDQAVIATLVNPAGSPPKGGGMVFKK